MKNDYSEYYSEASLWEKLKKFAKNAGAKVVYVVLLLYYTMQDSAVGLKTKISIAAALGYFIFPADAILDLTPIIGYSDDFGVLLFVLTQVARNITPEIKQKARQKLNDWFGIVNPEDITEIDNKIE
ncbi:MAG TPA: DUF1232 domain-containing protein [Draconibacterium sp.]|nr:DUF1232 domain-containing protein [Draconibacterium sp.]